MPHWVFILNGLDPVQLVPRTIDNIPGIPSRVLMSYSSWSAEKVLGLATPAPGQKSVQRNTLSTEMTADSGKDK